MAINQQELVDDYYEGKGELFAFPIAPIEAYKPLFSPLEEQSELVQELYGYHPDKARQLLVEAGYPDGFKVEVLCGMPDQIDMLQVIKEYWAKIGVTLELDVRDYAVYQSISTRFQHEQMVSKQGGMYWRHGMVDLAATSSQNYSRVNDPEVQQLMVDIQGVYADPVELNALFTAPTATRSAMTSYINEQAWYISLPMPYAYVLWQPWLKGYGGAIYIGYHCEHTYPMFVWIDQELKKSMVGR